MRPTALLCLPFLALVGCVHGTPSHSRAFGVTARPFAPPSLARAVPVGPTREAAVKRVGGAERTKAVAVAQSLVGLKQVKLSGVRYQDCSGFVVGVYREAGVDLRSIAADDDSGVAALYRYSEAAGEVSSRGTPSPGDLVFFNETYDRNRDGRLNDGLTHVGLVESVDDDGTVRVLHRVDRGVVRYRMNLKHPGTRMQGGVAVNDYLRSASAKGPAKLTSQLFAGFGSLGPASGTRAVARR